MLITHNQIGRFEVREFLGRGAIGDVWLAWDPRHSTEIALKTVRVSKADPQMLEAERNGVALQQQVAEVAPQVAAVYEQGQDGDFYWVAMEYIAGVDLSKVLEAGPLTEARALGIAQQLCGMLEIFHGFSAELGGRRIAGIVHGDLKPENIRLQDGDRVRVLDFGIAKHLSQTRRFTTNLFGSLPYTPPERLNTGRLDQQSDLWALGVLLYLMVCGYAPYQGRDPEEVETRIRRGERPEPMPPGVTPALRQVLTRCLAFHAERRYATAAALSADLAALAEGRPPAPAEPEAASDLNATRRTRLDDSGSSLGLSGTGGLNETRRTDRPAPAAADPELDGTRRTWEPEPGMDTGAAIPPPPPPSLDGPAVEAVEEDAAAVTVARAPRRHRRRWGLVLLGALLIAFGISQIYVRNQARDLRHDLLSDTEPDLIALLDRYRQISWIGMFNPTLDAFRTELREALVAEADRVIRSYHGDTPKTRERQWQQAFDDLKGAAELDYLDRGVRARMAYCRGHLERIQSQTLRTNGQVEQANAKLEDAISSFRDAADRDKSWPDPYLGLARIYSYERPDMDQLQKTLVELERRGYRLGRRERAMIGDGYLQQADQAWARAQRARGTDQEHQELENTRDLLLEAINAYEQVDGYANVRSNRAKAESRLHEVENRLSPPPPPAAAPPALNPARILRRLLREIH
jgi:serine/threonine protein kinase